MPMRQLADAVPYDHDHPEHDNAVATLRQCLALPDDAGTLDPAPKILLILIDQAGCEIAWALECVDYTSAYRRAPSDSDTDDVAQPRSPAAYRQHVRRVAVCVYAAAQLHGAATDETRRIAATWHSNPGRVAAGRVAKLNQFRLYVDDAVRPAAF